MRVEDPPDYSGPARLWPSLCRVSKKLVAIIGGRLGSENTNSCILYDLEGKLALPDLPNLKQGRSQSSSCYLGGHIYTFGGFHGRGYF